MSARQRMLVFFVEDTDAAEDLVAAIDFARQPPWRPNGPGVPFGTAQERYTEAEASAMILNRLRRAAPKVSYSANVIVP